MNSSKHDERAGSGAPPAVAIDEVLERFGGDMGLIVEVAAVFLEDYPSTLEKIRSAVKESDGEALHRAAHALKGSVANFAAHEAQAAAQALETIGRQRDMAVAGEGLRRLESALDRLAAALKALEDSRG